MVLATKAGIIPHARGQRETNVSRGTCSPRSTQSLRRLGVDHVDLWQVHTWVRRHPARGDAVGAGLRGQHRPGVVRRDLELLRLADRAGRHLAAGGAGPGPARLDAGGVLPAQPRRRARGARRPPTALGLGVLPWSPLGRGVLTGKYRTGHARRTPGRRPRTSRTSWATYLDDRSQRVVEAVARAADGLGWTPLEVALAWVRDRPGVTAPIVGARTAAQLRGGARASRS